MKPQIIYCICCKNWRKIVYYTFFSLQWSFTNSRPQVAWHLDTQSNLLHGDLFIFLSVNDCIYLHTCIFALCVCVCIYVCMRVCVCVGRLLKNWYSKLKVVSFYKLCSLVKQPNRIEFADSYHLSKQFGSLYSEIYLTGSVLLHCITCICNENLRKSLHALLQNEVKISLNNCFELIFRKFHRNMKKA